MIRLLSFLLLAFVPILNEAWSSEARSTVVKPTVAQSLMKMSKAFITKPDVELLYEMRQISPDPEFNYEELKKSQQLMSRHLEKAPVWFLRYLMVLYLKTSGEQKEAIFNDLFHYGLERAPKSLIFAFMLEQPLTPKVFTNDFIKGMFLHENKDIKGCKKRCQNLRYDVYSERIVRLKEAKLTGLGEKIRLFVMKEVSAELKRLEALLK